MERERERKANMTSVLHTLIISRSVLALSEPSGLPHTHSHTQTHSQTPNSISIQFNSKGFIGMTAYNTTLPKHVYIKCTIAVNINK